MSIRKSSGVISALKFIIKMAYSKNPVEKRFSIFEEQKNNRQKAIEILKQLKEKQNDKARNN